VFISNIYCIWFIASYSLHYLLGGEDVNVGESVKVKGTNIEGVIIRKGRTGLCMLDVTTEGYSGFGRTVFGEWDLERIKS